jgi:serine/threonine protein phosphatase PrpC
VSNVQPTPTTDKFNCITKFAFATSIGHQPGNPYKPNQDSYVLVPNMMNSLGLHLFGVCDGHGQNGHFTSQFCKEFMPQIFEKFIKEETPYEDNSRLEEFYEKVPKIMEKMFLTTHDEMIK